MAGIDLFLKQVLEKEASDIHLCTNTHPKIRIHGALHTFSSAKLTPRQTAFLFNEILTEEQRQVLEEKKNLDFAYEIIYKGEIRRFRAHVLYQKYGLDGYFRVISNRVPTLKELNLPHSLKKYVEFSQGIVLVTGPAGCGKTTTIAALIDEINRNQNKHIITIEEPIEYIHKNKKSLITQREVGRHASDFNRSLRAALRQDPDVIMIGELRDATTIHMAITAAETGHLVLATLHTSSGFQTVERIIESFSPTQQMQVRSMFSDSLRAIISQVLLPRKDKHARIPALEIVVGCLPVANLIREGRTFQLYSAIQTGQTYGMKILDDSLMELVKEKKIALEVARGHAVNRKNFEG